MVNPLERPKKANKPQPRRDSSQKRNNKKNNHNNNPQPNPWLLGETPPINPSTSFVEYLRWMRQPDDIYKDGTKIQILQMAQDECRNYNNRLGRLNQRTERIAQKSFRAKSAWRIRVGGHRGPENILLPAFDALGIPYLPSSSLRGVARNYAIREKMKNQCLSWEDAEKQIANYFGSIKTENKRDRAGKVVFLDAYPEKGCVEMDMANNIWTWEGNNVKYSPNPNPFLSLKEATFVIGLKLASNCQDEDILNKVKNWLIKGLEEGIGSQINSGYGQLIKIPDGKESSENSEQSNPERAPRSYTLSFFRGVETLDLWLCWLTFLQLRYPEFLRVELGWQGQLIHSYRKFTQWKQNDNKKWQVDGNNIAEVRSTAFKSMLRYWFRCFALGVLSIDEVQSWEGKLFGSINPQKIGYIKVNILEGETIQKEAKTENDNPGEQSGILTLSYSSEVSANQYLNIWNLMHNLTWIMLNLGGIGQGARRPNYYRGGDERLELRPPWWRGSTLFIDSEEDLWDVADNAQDFSDQLRNKIQNFYTALGDLIDEDINYINLRNNGEISNKNWQEAIDYNCIIVVCTGDSDYYKPYALGILHSQEFKKNRDYDPDLCGKAKEGAKPSPVWIAEREDYQVVTVFGATKNPRREFLEKLQQKANSYHQIFPITNT